MEKTEFGIKKQHIDQLVSYLDMDACAICFHGIIFSGLAGEYTVVLDTNEKELAIYLSDEGVWVCTVDIREMTYECHSSYDMLAAFVVIFGEIGLIE